jgi:hypothetical protein
VGRDEPLVSVRVFVVYFEQQQRDKEQQADNGDERADRMRHAQPQRGQASRKATLQGIHNLRYPTLVCRFNLLITFGGRSRRKLTSILVTVATGLPLGARRWLEMPVVDSLKCSFIEP